MLDLLVTGAARLLALARLTVDRRPAIERADVEWRAADTGVVIDPTLRQIPDRPDPWLEDGFWWMQFHGKWGSMHSRINGTQGPGSPWAQGPGDLRWKSPGAWLDHARLDPPSSSRSPLVDLSQATFA